VRERCVRPGRRSEGGLGSGQCGGIDLLADAVGMLKAVLARWDTDNKCLRLNNLFDKIFDF